MNVLTPETLHDFAFRHDGDGRWTHFVRDEEHAGCISTCELCAVIGLRVDECDDGRLVVTWFGETR